MDQPFASSPQIGRPRIRIGAVVALALATGLAAWIVLDRNREDSATTAVAQEDGPRLSTPDGLSSLAALRGSPVYWAGAQEGVVYEVTETEENHVFVRYLPSGTALGSPQPAFLTVATYPRRDAYAEVEAAARRPGAVAIALPRGGLAVFDEGNPTSVYVAYRGSDEQVEVYHPSAREARRLVESGRVRPVP